MVDEVTLAISIAAIVVSVVATIPLYLDYFTRRSEKRKENQLKFEIERFQEIVTSPFESAWSIRIISPTETIEHCSVTLQLTRPDPDWANFHYPLAVWDKTKEVYNQTKIAKGRTANFRIPKTVNPFGMFVVVRDKEKELLRRDFRDIPETNA